MAITKTYERTGQKSGTYIVTSTADADTTTIELNGNADIIWVNSLGNITPATGDTFLLELAWVASPASGDWQSYANADGNNPWAAANSNEQIPNMRGVKKIRLTRTGATDGSVKFHISTSIL